MRQIFGLEQDDNQDDNQQQPMDQDPSMNGGQPSQNKNILAPLQGNTMGMAGLLLASGVPYDKALEQASQMTLQEQQGQRASGASGMTPQKQQALQMLQQTADPAQRQQILYSGIFTPIEIKKLDGMYQDQAKARGIDDMLNSLMGNSPPTTPGQTSTIPSGNTQASTLADMNAGAATDPTSPNNIYSQMDDPNAVPSPSGDSMGGGSSGGIDAKTKSMAKLLIQSGDKKGAIKLIMDAQKGALPGGYVKDAMMGPSRGGQGGTYTNPQTGQAISSNTSKQTSQDQATVAAIGRLEPMMNTIIDTLPQFQRASTQAQVGIQGFANKYLDGNYELPSTKAEGESAVNAAPDALLKVLGLPSTDKGLDTVQGIIKPQDGESPEFYKKRAVKQLLEFQNNYSNAAKDRLREGIDVSKQPNDTSQSIVLPQAPAMQQSAQQPLDLLNMALAERARRAQLKNR